MCVPCVLQVSRAFTFKQLCQRSDQTLRSFYREIDNCITNNQKTDVLKETKAIVVNKTSENNVSSMTIASKPLDPLVSESASVATTTSLPNLDDKLFNLQYQSSNIIHDQNLDKCLLIVNNESAELADSAIDDQVNLTDNDIVNLITTAASDENQLAHTENYACSADTTLIDLKVQGNDVESIIGSTVENNMQSTESIDNDIKVDVLSALDSNVMETDLIDDNFGL